MEIKKRKRKISDGIRRQKNISHRREDLNQVKKNFRTDLEISPPEDSLLPKKGRNSSPTVPRSIVLSLWKMRKVLFVFLVFFASLFFLLKISEKARIVYHPKMEILDLDKKVSASRFGERGNFHFGIIHIPDREELKVETNDYREEEGFARGKVTIFNDYSSEPQRLLPHTRFLSASGKLFYSGDEEIVIPGKKNGKAGMIDILLTASEKGPDYNIDLTDFNLPGFRELGLTEKYEKIYAISKEKFRGGEKKKIPVLSEMAKKKAEDLVRSKLKELLLGKLFSKKTDSLRIVEKGVQLKFKNLKWKAEGEKNFTISVEGEIDALVVQEDELKKFLLRYAEKKLNSNEGEIKFGDGELKSVIISYEGRQNLDFRNIMRAPLRIVGSYPIIWIVNPEEILNDVRGLDRESFLKKMREKRSIASIEVRISPFWVDKIYNDEEKLEIRESSPLLVKKKKEATEKESH